MISEGVLPNWNKQTEIKFKELGINILQNPIDKFEHTLRDGNAVDGFTGIIDDKKIAFLVYKEGINKGLIATSIVPTPQQAENWGVKL